MDKWMDMLGLYDFLGVICPGIFVSGSIILIMLTNSNIIVPYMSYSEVFKSLISNESLMSTYSCYIYAYIIVVVYVLGSLVHELGHIGEWIHNHGLKSILKITHPKDWIHGIFGDGCIKAEEGYLTEDLSNSNKLERMYWFALLIKSDFTKRKLKGFSIDCFDMFNIKRKEEEVKMVSSEFYQHCKRVVSINGLDHSSKKKESIYGFSRNISFIFLDLIILFVGLLLFGKLSIKCLSAKFLLEIGFCFAIFIVFRIKSIRYKNMEIVDVLRTYRYIADNKKQFYANKKK